MIKGFKRLKIFDNPMKPLAYLDLKHMYQFAVNVKLGFNLS